ncbi:MAG: hypothetical protein LBJ67_14310, partial [Planctomycetaceae bacterium]|nr:hypothetical protein [Planctomycetaceae bacterium]
FDGSASGVGSSSDVSHSYNITETDSAWSYSCGNYVSGGSSDYENGSGGDSNQWANYNYSASWSWDNEGNKSASISNQVSGHHESSSYSYKDNYWEGYGCGCDYSCTDGYSNSTSYTHLDYNDSIQHTGWSSKGGKTTSPFSVKWSSFYGSYDDGSSSCCYYGGGCCGYDYDYSYQGYSFSAPNFSVSMSESTYNGEVSESNEVWHSGRSNYYYYSNNGYLYSQTAPTSHIPAGSNPSAISGAGQTTHVTIPIIETGEPNFNNYAYVNVGSILDAAFPEPEITQPVSTLVPCTELDSIGFAFLKGLAQGGVNTINGLQDIAIGTINLGLFGGYNLTSWVVNQAGGENPYIGIPSPDWSRDLITEEYGGAGTWGDTHGWSKFSGGNGVLAAFTGASLAGTKAGSTTMSELPGFAWNEAKNTIKSIKTWLKGEGNAGNKIKTNLDNEIDFTPLTNHSVTTSNPGYKGTANSSIDILDSNGNIQTRRWFGNDGKAVRDVDMTNHGNSSTHPEWPHEHFWQYGPDGKPINR